MGQRVSRRGEQRGLSGLVQWFGLLNLEAPIVALGWQGLFARYEGVELRTVDRAALFGAVWIVYFVDRWLDGRSPGYPAPALRHRFQSSHARWYGLCAVVLCCCLGAWAFLALDRAVWLGASFLAVATGLHLLAAQGRDIFGVERPWKEARVGLIFALGCHLIPSVASGAPLLNDLALGFAALCVANCRLIELWEWEDSSARHWGWDRALVGLAVVYGVTGTLRPAEAGFWGCLAFSSALSLLVNRSAQLVGLSTRRFMADVALMTPWALLV